MPLGLFITTKANPFAGKYTFSYSPPVLWWRPLSHFKGKREFFLASPWFQHLFKISSNIPNIGKKALLQGSRQVLLSHKRHLQLTLRPYGRFTEKQYDFQNQHTIPHLYSGHKTISFFWPFLPRERAASTMGSSY